LYVPLGGSRTTERRTYANLVTVFFLCGLWHGASWNFVVWGLFHGTFLVLERLGLADFVKRRRKPLQHAYVLLVVMIGWVFFRADSLGEALAFLKAMAGLNHAAVPIPFTVRWFLTPELLLALLAGALGSAPLGRALSQARGKGSILGSGWALDLLVTAGLVIVLAASAMQVAAGSYNPFIYFRF
jgi:alginate O-acetyltransferase complex protein AlgI